ncbi:hypothetical protein CDL15_Pgr024455 [Punica granatum]|uniref:Membrane insertase YidC/Oxa/ALB C-terminal domain-containing protein n=1 Tax=Punica granatum TaxID=22663 RepID=A0A218XXC2_PUNGR|nr:hypothetical protein CDL15_Pgr024455 [Punica granatum]PKI32536.1 hypothetical protein CRG98_047080 [Punica granatum]
MASSPFSLTSSTVLPPFPAPKTPFLLHRPCFGAPPHSKPFLRGTLCVARLGFRPDQETAEYAIRELFSRAEGLIYTVADAAVSASDTVVDTTSAAKQNNDWLSGIANYMEAVLKVLKDGLSTLHVPYAYGFAIILLTVLVKAATFPLTKKQVESAMAMRSLQPQIKAIQQRYAGDQERIQLETARLYKLAGINPLAGCLPTLATIPVWIGLYRALSNVADEGLLTEGFFWIPSLAGPTTIAARQNGSGISWLFPFVDGHPPLGWSDTLAYLVLPLLLVISQYISVQIMQSSQPQSNDPNMKNSQAITKFLPVLIGYFALSVPSGLSLYWFTNNILSTAQQVWLQRLGGAKNPLAQSAETIIKQEEERVQKTGSDLTAARMEPVKEKLIAEGPRPGERFKQIKEQEERQKREREQQKKPAEETVLSNERNEEDRTLRSGSVNGAIDEHKTEFNTRDSSNGGVAVNGGLSNPVSKEEQKEQSVQLESSDASMSHEAQGVNDRNQS